MEDKYAGDVGDFAKLGMLRALGHSTGLAIGLNWSLVPDDDATGGALTRYLGHNPDLCRCDQALAEELRRIVTGPRRTTTALQASQILPDAWCFSDLLTYPTRDKTASARIRDAWFAASLVKLRSAEIVFLDPDNGLQVPSLDRQSRKGIKYTANAEVMAHLENGQSDIVYNRLPPITHIHYVKRYHALRHHLAQTDPFPTLRFHRYAARDFAFILTDRHRALVERFLTQFTSGPWGVHFTLLRL
jgi:hypothetical protein